MGKTSKNDTIYKTIRKFSLSSDGSKDINIVSPGNPFTVEMPEGAVILSVQIERSEKNNYLGVGVIWAIVNPESKPSLRKFCLVQTEQLFDPSDLEYIGTYPVHDGALTLHCFEYQRDEVMKVT